MKQTQKMMYCALFAALTALCAWITIPFPPISFTMQTFSVFLTFGLLGGKWGGVSILIYLLLGAVGLPVFSGFQGGMSVLVGPTGGFLWGFLVAAPVYRAFERIHIMLAMVTGLIVCYTSGCIGYLIYVGDGSFSAVLGICVLPFVIPDGIKLWLAYRMTQRLCAFVK